MAGSHLDDHQLLDLAMGQASPEEANSGQDHCSKCGQCRQRLESLRSLAQGLGQLGEGEDVPTPSAELWRQLSRRAQPLLEELSRSRRDSRRDVVRKQTQPAVPRPASTRRLLPRRSWIVAASVLLLVGVASGGWFFWPKMTPTAAAAILETSGPVKIAQRAQLPRYCRGDRELLRVGDVLTTPKIDAAIRLEDATRLTLRQGCRLEARPPASGQQATFALRDGSVCVDTTRAKRGCCVETPAGTVRCGKAKTLIQLTSPQECTVATLDGEVEVRCDGHVGVVSPGVCVDLKRSKPCCYRPARPHETQCDWVDRCGQPREGRKP